MITWEDIEIFCNDCIMKDMNICPCDEIIDNFASGKGIPGESIQGTYKAQKN